MKRLGTIGWTAFILLFIGAINWGLIGLFNYNLVEAIFGFTLITRIIYVLVGLSAIYMLAVISMPAGGVYRDIGNDPRHQKPINDRRFGDRRKAGPEDEEDI